MFPRQYSKTTSVAAYLLHYIIFNDNKNVAILANKASAAREVMSRIQLMFEELPKWLQPGIRTWNKGDIHTENGSKIFTAATSPSGVRGKSVNVLYIDEAGFVPGAIWESFWSSVYPTISSGKQTKVIMTSTPYGMNHFWKLWNDSVNKLNDFVSFRVQWHEHPERDDTWLKEQEKALGSVQFAQEILCEFNGSSNTLISGSVLSTLSPSPYVYQTEDGLDIIEKPVQGHQYFMMCDTSEGRSKDYSAFTIIDITGYPFKVVAKYRNNKIQSHVYPNVINRIATEYNQAYVLIEVNKAPEVAYILYNEIEYENLLCTKQHEKKGQILIEGGTQKTRLGVNTDKKVKRIGCNTLKALIEDQKLLVRDSDIISELASFIEKGNSYEGDSGKNDDLVACLFLFAWATTTELFEDLTNNNHSRQTLYERQLQQIDDELLLPGYFSNGQTQFDPYAPTIVTF
jgi:hypothetical protein